jgi:hypothetical protein
MTMDRRAFLKVAGAASLLASRPAHALAARWHPWSDPRTWARKVPGRRDIAVVRKPVILDVDARVAGVVIEPGGALRFDPRHSRTLVSRGNVVVNGLLRMNPAGPAVTHVLRFAGIDESRYAGGGHQVLESDVGLWVVHHGRLDLRGTRREPWARSAGNVSAGSTMIEIDGNPTTWRRGDEIVVTPTGPPSGTAGDADSFDVVRVQEVSERVMTLDRPLKYDHPAVAGLSAEVLNLTRNVRIEGTREGRSHVFIHSAHPQTIRNVALRHVGPRAGDGAVTRPVLGRYGIHFHHAYSGSRESIVENTVVRDSGNHSFVPHTSHGITFRRCIAYDVVETPYWWDEGDRTDDTTWDECVAARVRAENNISASDLTGFFLGRGTGNSATRCVAAGIGGEKTASGFEWPPEPADGVWVVDDCVAHNNAANAIFVWQRNARINTVNRFIGYHNGAGVLLGSSLNSFRFADLLLYANATWHVRLHANSVVASDGVGLRFDRARLDGAGTTHSGVVVAGHLSGADLPVEFRNSSLAGLLVPIRFDETGGSKPGLQDFVRCSIDGRNLGPPDFDIEIMIAGSAVRVQALDDASAFHMDHTGAVLPIAPFSD